jgi:hypothetical protein
MRMSSRAWTIIAALISIGLLAFPNKAAADQLYTRKEVVCQSGASVALVRFTTAYNDDAPVYRRLPPNIDQGLSARPPSRREDCTMTNGWNVRVRSGEKQTMPYGMGGGDPPAFFSLWIARHKVFSRNEWKPGYGNDTDPWVVAVVILPNRLTICRVPGGLDAPAKGKLSCSDEPLRLDRHKIDAIEYAKPERGLQLERCSCCLIRLRQRFAESICACAVTTGPSHMPWSIARKYSVPLSRAQIN